MNGAAHLLRTTCAIATPLGNRKAEGAKLSRPPGRTKPFAHANHRGQAAAKKDKGGVFAQRGHSANYYGDYPGNNPENHAPAEFMHNQFKSQKFKHLMRAMGPRDLNSAPL